MRLYTQGGVFALESSFNDRAIPKAAGFVWHDPTSDRHWKDCKACPAGLGKTWWTWLPEVAVQLLEYADEETAAKLDPARRAVTGSRQADSSLEIPRPDGLEFLGYQKAGIAYTLERKHTLIADEMGLGKTIQALGLVNALPAIRSVLVLCPATLRLNWRREAAKWLTRNFDFWTMDSSGAVPPWATFVIANYDKLRNEVVFDSLMQREWDLLVCDESHLVKNPDAQRTQKVLGGVVSGERNGTPAPGLFDRAGMALFLTGTPILNRPFELWPLLSRIQPEEFGNRWIYRKRFCGGEDNGASRLPELQARLRALCMVRRLKKDVLKDLPRKLRQVVTIPADDYEEAIEAERSTMGGVAEEKLRLAVEAEAAKASGDEAAYKDAVSRLLGAGFVAFEQMARVRHETALRKVPAVLEHLDAIFEDGVSKVVVFAHHHDVIAQIAGHFGDSSVTVTGETPIEDRQANVDRFQNDPGCKVFIGSITAAGMGITLTAASHVVFAELDWVPANVTQAEDRCHRIGQHDSVLVQHVVLDGSLDAKLANTILDKQRIADDALDVEHELPKAAPTPPVPPPTFRQPESLPAPSSFTREQKDVALEAMRILAGMDGDRAATRNGEGFSKYDTQFGHSLAGRSWLTDRQVAAALKMARKYRRQLPAGILVQLFGEKVAA